MDLGFADKRAQVETTYLTPISVIVSHISAYFFIIGKCSFISEGVEHK
jgi:hypothetical protein